MIINFGIKHNDFMVSEKGSEEESLLFLSMLYCVCPAPGGIYWKGTCYSESHFCSTVLQVLLRHTDTTTRNRKIGTFIYRVFHLEKWDGNSETQKGIGVSTGFIEEKILSKYYDLIGDEDGKKAAKDFENNIKTLKEKYKHLKNVESNEIDFEKGSNKDLVDDYDNAIHSVLLMTAYMKGDMSYILPRTYLNESQPYVAADLDDFRQYFARIMDRYKEEEKGLEKIASFIKDIDDDNSFRYFLEYQKGKQ